MQLCAVKCNTVNIEKRETNSIWCLLINKTLFRCFFGGTDIDVFRGFFPHTFFQSCVNEQLLAHLHSCAITSHVWWYSNTCFVYVHYKRHQRYAEVDKASSLHSVQIYNSYFWDMDHILFLAKLATKDYPFSTTIPRITLWMNSKLHYHLQY